MNAKIEFRNEQGEKFLFSIKEAKEIYRMLHDWFGEEVYPPLGPTITGHRWRDTELKDPWGYENKYPNPKTAPQMQDCGEHMVYEICDCKPSG